MFNLNLQVLITSKNINSNAIIGVLSINNMKLLSGLKNLKNSKKKLVFSKR